MFFKVFIVMSFLVGVSIGYSFGPGLWPVLGVQYTWLENPIVNAIISGILFSLVGVFLAPHIEKYLKKLIKTLEKQETGNLILGTIGIIIGLILGYLVSMPFINLNVPVVSTITPFVTSFLLATVGYYVLTNRSDELKEFFARKPAEKNESVEGEILERRYGDNFYKYKLLDTSVIIDGRIVDVVKAGFLEGVLVIPNFVLDELQGIADSADSLTRAKGRRGLDILNELQNDNLIPIEFYEGDFDEVNEVDTKLVRLAKLIDGAVVTNDYNLNKVCEFQNIKVFNINELANAVKPVLIPGEKIKVKILKEGSERKQGVAYLDDGTMIVVEDGVYYMNEYLTVVVTSAIQTSAGRMIFAKPLHSGSRLDSGH